jgi:hypothetical protein
MKFCSSLFIFFINGYNSLGLIAVHLPKPLQEPRREIKMYAGQSKPLLLSLDQLPRKPLPLSLIAPVMLDLDMQIERHIAAIDPIAGLVGAVIILADLGGRPSLLLLVAQGSQPGMLALQVLELDEMVLDESVVGRQLLDLDDHHLVDQVDLPELLVVGLRRLVLRIHWSDLDLSRRSFGYAGTRSSIRPICCGRPSGPLVCGISATRCAIARGLTTLLSSIRSLTDTN